MSEARFNRAVSIIQNMPRDGPVKPSTEDRLHFYGYFKQATVGDLPADNQRPGLLDFEGKAKWDAWKSREGVSKETCWKEYADRLEQLLKKYNDEASKKHLEELNAA